MKIFFWGATNDVTGSMTLLETPEGKILIDCGLHQGPEEVQNLNTLALPFKPTELTSIIITHAHLDHSGLLPLLVKKGFKGAVYCTLPTSRLMRIILLDSAKLNEDELYEVKDVQQALNRVMPVEWNRPFKIAGAEVSLFPAGHILGASSVALEHAGKKYVFSGDLGREDDPLLPPPAACPPADFIIMESTYGGKRRPASMKAELISFLQRIRKEDRVGIIASFAVARAQNLLTMIHEHFKAHPEDKIRVVMDGPMMKDANLVYQKYASLTHCQESVFQALTEVDAIEYQKEWESLKKKTGPLIIISSSGMLSGGRIGRHLHNWCNDPRAVLFLPGYQGAGTPGRSLLEGNRRLKGPEGVEFEWTGEVINSDAFSSHADQQELLNWVCAKNKSAQIFLLHGEASSKEKLKQALLARGFDQVEIPARGTTFPST
jgi:metallo-beta-lactamase family protein